MPTLAERFHSLFAGLERGHGWYVIPAGTKPDENGKLTGPRATSREPVTLALWEGHLAGKRGLGIVPAREDGKLRFAAADIDEYPHGDERGLDLPALCADVARHRMPLIVCRTKSGGAHLYFFTPDPLDAATVRANMAAYAATLGFPGVEIFPKQDRIKTDEDVGNWINMPYFGGSKTSRYALDEHGNPVAIDDFLDWAESMNAATPAYEPDDDTPPWERPENQIHERPTIKDSFGGAPPCLVTLATNGFPAGTRNNALFNLGVYAKKIRGTGDWKAVVYDFNARLMIPPLPEDEVKIIVKSLERKRYFYKCKDHPIAQVCDKKVCLTREHGVGGGAAVDESGINFGPLTKVLTKPVVWLWEIDGELLDFETPDLMNQQAFQARVMEMLSTWPPTIKAGMWRGLVQSRMEQATEIQPPKDATVDGQLWEQLMRFCTSRVVGFSIDELLLGKPFTDLTAGRSYFVSTDFLAHLSQHRFATRMTEHLLYMSLRERGLEHHTAVIKGVKLSYWSVPAFEAQTEDHDVPQQEVEGAM